MVKHHYNTKLDIPSDADSARFFVPAGYTARLEDGVLILETKESEGEKIRKEIISFIRAFWVDHRDSVPQTSKWLDWLEKQKEQKEQKPDIEICPHTTAGKSYSETGYPIEKKPEWSAEDERILYNVIAYVGYAAGQAGVKDDLFKEANDWLKSLRPQPHWKPSVEQMRCLRAVVQDVNKKSLMSTTGYSPAAVLQSLYIDLKALM